jgi:hypothetical protein
VGLGAGTSWRVSAGGSRWVRSRKASAGGLAQVKVRGLAKVRAVFVFGIAYNLVRLPKLLPPTGEVCPAA